MIQLQGSYTFEAPQAVVWDAVRDPNVLSRVLPGCERLEEVGENEYAGEINIRVGPVQGKFQGKVALSDIVEPESYYITLHGQGQPGFVQGGGTLKLESNGSQTTLHYTGEAQVSGRIASVGQRLMDSSARSIVRQGLESLDKLIGASLQPPATAAVSATVPVAQPVTPPKTTQVAAGVAKDVAKDVARDVMANLAQTERQSNLRAYAVITIGILAVLWMYNLLFGRSGD